MIISASQVTDLLGVSSQTLYNWRLEKAADKPVSYEVKDVVEAIIERPTTLHQRLTNAMVSYLKMVNHGTDEVGSTPTLKIAYPLNNPGAADRAYSAERNAQIALKEKFERELKEGRYIPIAEFEDKVVRMATMVRNLYAPANATFEEQERYDRLMAGFEAIINGTPEPDPARPPINGTDEEVLEWALSLKAA